MRIRLPARFLAIRSLNRIHCRVEIRNEEEKYGKAWRLSVRYGTFKPDRKLRALLLGKANYLFHQQLSDAETGWMQL